MPENKAISINSERKKNSCLSCGTSENINNRKYCSIKCRQNLRQRLNARNGLLQALNTRWAAFYFSDKMIYLDIYAAGYKEVFRFSHVRALGQKPSDDFGKMANELGRAWWEEERRSKKKYLASRRVLDLAEKSPSVSLVRPKTLKIYCVHENALSCLGMGKADLESANLKVTVKNAYRRQAKIHHPDLGGQASTFRKINDAYQELLRWAENPRFIKRKGFTEKWFYDGDNKKWVQPMSVKNISSAAKK